MEFILSIVTIETLGDWSFTKYVKDKRQNIFYKLLGYGCYIGLLEMFQRTIQLKGLAWANSAWDGWSNITTGALAILFFRETPSLREWIGIVLISVGLFFLGGGTNGYHKE